jgi:hypothetical protein
MAYFPQLLYFFPLISDGFYPSAVLPPNTTQAAAPVSIPSCLLLLPLYSMSLQKSSVIRGGNDVRVDERAYFQQLLLNMDIEEVRCVPRVPAPGLLLRALLFLWIVTPLRAPAAALCYLRKGSM